MKYMINVCVLVLSLVLSVGLSGCDSENSGTHDLTVQWNIAGLQVCKSFLPEGQYASDEVAFSKVAINIYEDQSATVALQEPIIVPCEVYNYKITRLERGSYYVTVDAMAEYGDEELAFFKGASKVSVPVNDDQLDIELSIGTGDIQVFWQFDGGMICGIDQPGEVADVLISLGDIEVEVPCGEGRVELTEMAPGSQYELSAAALSVKGEVLYETELEGPLEILPGQSYQADLVF